MFLSVAVLLEHALLQLRSEEHTSELQYLAVIIEVAAMNDRQKKMGFNAAKELQERMLKQYGN